MREGPVTGKTTPVLFAVAGPRERIVRMLDRAESRVKKLFGGILDGANGDLLMHLDCKLASTNGRFLFEDLIDAFYRSLISEDAVCFPRLAHVSIDSQRAAMAMYSTPTPDDAVDTVLIDAVLAGWLNVESRPGLNRPWTEHDVREMLLNPIYGYGVVFEPVGDLIETIDEFVQSLADRQDEPKLDELDREFRELFARFEASERFRRLPDVKALVGKELWLKTILVRVRKIRNGEED